MIVSDIDLSVVGLAYHYCHHQVLTLAKTCERVETIRQCERNRDWSILALQNIRTGKAHYLVICTCPASGILGRTFTWDWLSYLLLCIQRGP